MRLRFVIADNCTIGFQQTDQGIVGPIVNTSSDASPDNAAEDDQQGRCQQEVESKQRPIALLIHIYIAIAFRRMHRGIKQRLNRLAAAQVLRRDRPRVALMNAAIPILLGQNEYHWSITALT